MTLSLLGKNKLMTFNTIRAPLLLLSIFNALLNFLLLQHTLYSFLSLSLRFPTLSYSSFSFLQSYGCRFVFHNKNVSQININNDTYVRNELIHVSLHNSESNPVDDLFYEFYFPNLSWSYPDAIVRVNLRHFLGLDFRPLSI
jgi:hypothetical protein